MEAEIDPLAVVSQYCQVISTENFLCENSFLLPQITDGNLNSSSIVTGKNAAGHILDRTRLPPLNYSLFIHLYWQTQQR